MSYFQVLFIFILCILYLRMNIENKLVYHSSIQTKMQNKKLNISRNEKLLLAQANIPCLKKYMLQLINRFIKFTFQDSSKFLSSCAQHGKKRQNKRSFLQTLGGVELTFCVCKTALATLHVLINTKAVWSCWLLGPLLLYFFVRMPTCEFCNH